MTCCVLDASAALCIALNKQETSEYVTLIESTDWVIAPDIFIPEVTNALWKYHQFEDLPIHLCELALDTSIHLIDDVVESKALYNESFAMACQVGQPVYDVLYLITARRHNGVLITADKRLSKIAQKHSIKTI
jgi:predicted nucleic acid-binding protein